MHPGKYGEEEMDNFWRGKSVVITGANGFLGSHLSIGLLKKDAQVIGIIKEKPPVTLLNLFLQENKKKGIKIIKSDIVDFKETLEMFKKYSPDVCLHLAAQPIVGIANKSPLPTFEANIKGTWNILEAGRICNTRAIIVASSDKAYGEHKRLPYKEEAALCALHPYDASKACADILARCYAHTYGLNTAVTRCANIYGPGDFNFSRIIPDTMRSVIFNRNPIIRSDGTPLRDYIYIDDVVKAYLLLAAKLYLRQVNHGEAFNFGMGEPISVLSLVNKILRIAKRQDLKPQILSKKKISGEIDKQYLSSLKARKELGWESRYSIDAGLKKTFAWYLKNSKCLNP